MATREGKFLPGWRKPRSGRTEPISTAPSPFTWTAKPLALVFLNSADVDLRGFIAARSLAVLFNHAPGLVGIFLAHQNNRPPDSGKNILLSVQGRDVGVNSRRLQQAVHHQRFRFLFGIEHSHQLFVGVGTYRGTVFHSSSH